MKNEETRTDIRKLREQNMESNHSTNSVIGDEERTMLLSRASRAQKSSAEQHSAKDETLREEKQRKKLPWWISTIFWIFRKSIAPIIMIIMLLAGLYIGYVVIGDQPKEDVLQWSTWKHLWDLIFADS